MFEEIIRWDKALFFLINSVWTSPLKDEIMPLLRNKYIWAPLYVFIAAFFLKNYKIHGVYVLLYLGVVVLFCDQISTTLKPFIQRLRPCHDDFWIEHLRLLVGCGKSFGFPSNHAANHFGVAAFLGVLLWRNSRFILPVALLWAGVICYAQVYVGVHYPLDILGGAVLGSGIGLGMALLLKRYL